MLSLYGNSFDLQTDHRAMIGDFVMDPSEHVAELRAGANLARPELQAAMLATMQAGLIGAGMPPAAARGRANDLLFNGAGSFDRGQKIVLTILG